MTVGIEHVNDYPLIRFEIRFERKFPIRRSLVDKLIVTSLNCLTGGHSMHYLLRGGMVT